MLMLVFKQLCFYLVMSKIGMDNLMRVIDFSIVFNKSASLVMTYPRLSVFLRGLIPDSDV